jgi:hypothetical protein
MLPHMTAICGGTFCKTFMQKTVKGNSVLPVPNEPKHNHNSALPLIMTKCSIPSCITLNKMLHDDTSSQPPNVTKPKFATRILGSGSKAGDTPPERASRDLRKIRPGGTPLPPTRRHAKKHANHRSAEKGRRRIRGLTTQDSSRTESAAPILVRERRWLAVGSGWGGTGRDEEVVGDANVSSFRGAER